MWNRRVALAAGGILLLSLLLRLHYVRNTLVDNPFRGDARQYVAVANNLLSNGVYSSGVIPPLKSDALRFPGYPFFLLPFMIFTSGTGSFLTAVYSIQAIISTCCLLLLYLISRKIFPEWVSLSVLFAAGINPFLITFSGYLLVEVLYTLLLLGFLLSFMLAVERGSLPATVGAGILFGLGLLVKPTLLFFVFILLPFLLRREVRNMFDMRRFAAFLLLAALVYSPWALFSYRVEGSVLGSKATAMANLATGTYPGMQYKNGTPGIPYREDPTYPQWSTSTGKILSHLSENIKQDPWTYIWWFGVGKPLFLWEWSLLEGQGDIFLYPVVRTPYYDNLIFQFTRRLSYVLYHLVLFSTLAYLSIRLLRPSWLNSIGLKDCFRLDLMLGILVYFTTFQSLLSPYQRYSIPFRLLLFPIGLGFLLMAGASVSSSLRIGLGLKNLSKNGGSKSL